MEYLKCFAEIPIYIDSFGSHILFLQPIWLKLDTWEAALESVYRAYKEIKNLTLNKLKRSELRRDFFRLLSDHRTKVKLLLYNRSLTLLNCKVMWYALRHFMNRPNRYNFF